MQAVPIERRLATNEARERLYKLVSEMSRLRKGRASLLERAVEVGPRGKGGALLIPSVDVQATLDEMAKQQDDIEALQDQIEELALANLISERRDAPESSLTSLERLAANLGRSHLLAEE
jgi:phosphopantetheine adenylyltransferase